MSAADEAGAALHRHRGNPLCSLRLVLQSRWILRLGFTECLCLSLTVREAAGALRVDQQQVRGWIKQGLIEVMCLGPRQTRIPATALARFIKQQTMRLTAFSLEAAA